MKKLALLLMCAGCGFDFDRVSEVKDLRVLGLATSPPELTPLATSLDVNIGALVVGLDAGTSVEYVWTTCLTAPSVGGGGFGFGSSAQRCPSDGGTTVEASRGTAPVDALGTTIAVPFQALAVLASGIKGLTLSWQVQLQVNDLYAVKQVALTPTLHDGQAPNENPPAATLTFDGEDWPAGAAKSIGFDACPADKRAMEMDRTGKLNPTVCRHELQPTTPDAGHQVYFDVGLSGEIEEQTELMRYSWFADVGTLEQESTQEPNPDFALGRKIFSTSWNEPKTKPTGPVTVWVVTRDGRGGESWTSRQLVFP